MSLGPGESPGRAASNARNIDPGSSSTSSSPPRQQQHQATLGPVVSALLCLALIITPLIPVLAMAAWWRHEQSTTYLAVRGLRRQRTSPVEDAAFGLGGGSGGGGFHPDVSSCSRSPLDPNRGAPVWLLMNTGARPAVICKLHDVLFPPRSLTWDREWGNGSATLWVRQDAPIKVGRMDIQCGSTSIEL